MAAAPSSSGEPVTGFAAEIANIYEAGARTLPTVSAIYAKATGSAHNASWHGGDAFEQPTVVQGADLPDIDEDREPGFTVGGSTDLGPVYPAWSALRNFLHSLLSETAEITAEAGGALVAIATAYAECDDAARVAISQIEPIDAPPPVNVGDPYQTHVEVIDPPIFPPFSVEVLDGE
jgi:hypothetical protein